MGLSGAALCLRYLWTGSDYSVGNLVLFGVPALLFLSCRADNASLGFVAKGWQVAWGMCVDLRCVLCSVSIALGCPALPESPLCS